METTKQTGTGDSMKNQEIKKSELYERRQSLKMVSKIRLPHKFCHAAGRNLDKVNRQIKLLEKTRESTDKHLEYIKAKEEIYKENCKKDKSGEIVTFIAIVRGEEIEKYDVQENLWIVKDQIRILDEKYSDAISEQEKINEAFDKSLDDDIEIDVFQIDLEVYEETELSVEEVSATLWMIKE